MTELRLLLSDQQFAEIHVHESNKCADVILSTSEQYKLENGGDQHSEKEIAPQSRPIQKENKAQITNLIPDPSQTVHPSSIILKSDNQARLH